MDKSPFGFDWTGKETAARQDVYTAVKNWGRFLPRVEKSLCN
jgi:hypothetical protein